MKKNIVLGSNLFIVYNVLGFITFYKHLYLLPLMLISTFLISFVVFKKYSNIKCLKTGLILVLPLPLIMLITCIVGKDFSRLLPYILFVPLSSYLAYLYFKCCKIYIPVLSCLLFAFVSFFLFPNFFAYYYNSHAEKSIKFNPISLTNGVNKNIILAPEKVIVLDFWSTNCGICFTKFPDLEATFQKYKSNKNVEIYAVNVPIRGDKFEKTIKILDSIGYKFPKLYAKSLTEVEDKLKFNIFPHLMIIKNNLIRYDGFLLTRYESQLYNIEDQIDKLLLEK